VQDVCQPALRERILVELLSIGVLAAVYLLAFPARPRYLDGVFGLLAVALIGASAGSSRRIWAEQPAVSLPYRRRLRSAFGWVMLFTVPATLLLLVVGLSIGYARGGWTGAAERVSNWHLIPAVAIYLLWALVQQFVFQFYLLGRLLYLLPPPWAIAATALIFSAVHFPRVAVMAAVAVAAVVWSTLYRRYRTLVPLAVSHAILGSTLHMWVFGRDLFAQWLLR
jgi:membrane protease YdiL (CAAX protease family)